MAEKPKENGSDFFGMGRALRACTEIYFTAARRSGRTTALLDSLKNGDRVVFPVGREAERFKMLAKERGLEIEVVAIAPTRLPEIFHRGTSQGRTIFEHTWLEEYYRWTLETAEKHIAEIQVGVSGYGERHRETARAAKEMERWRHIPLPSGGGGA